MSRSVKALINPELLVWARKTAHIDLATAAVCAKVPFGTIEAWEVGRDAPTISKLRLLCKALERDVSQDVFDAWFRALDFERYDGTTLTVSVPVKFLKKWLDAH
jgi:transcriptional regulator with XRE-family HTH domain